MRTGRRRVAGAARWACLVAAAAVAAGAFEFASGRAPSLRHAELPAVRTDDEWALAGRVVAHALGAVDGVTYTNSREAFAGSVARGFRVFEVDLARTADGALVARHGWEDVTPHAGLAGLASSKWLARERPLSLAEFRAQRVAGRFSPLTAADVVRLMADQPGALLVLDLKGDFGQLLAQFVSEARRTDSTVLRRVVPQLYQERDLATAVGVYPFRSFVYTLYRTRASDAEVADFVRRTGVRVVTASEDRFSPALARAVAAAGGVVYVHTVNDPARARALRDAGATGIYSDTLAQF